MKTLAIETSCDDTSFALVSEESGYFVCEKMLTDTQKLHNNYGGVVPEIASRTHADRILPLWNRFLAELGWSEEDVISQIDCITITTYPGLPGSLVVGKMFAYMMGRRYDKPVVEVNHLYGHVLSVLIDRNRHDIILPMVVLSASGGHTDLYLVESGEGKIESEQKIGDYYITKLGESRDDAAGEVFDKVARLLGGPYPGGKWIGERAESRKLKIEHERSSSLISDGINTIPDIKPMFKKIKSPYHFKRIMLEGGSLDFSFSGMKSQAYTFIDRMKKIRSSELAIKNKPLHAQSTFLNYEQIGEIAYEFQEAITDVLSKKLFSAVLRYDAQTIALVGGVSANIRLREKLLDNTKDRTILLPTKFEYCTDNAAMIGVVGLLSSM